jgi:hypothetical protein
MFSPALIPGTLSLCASAGACISVTEKFLKNYGPALRGIFSTALTVKEKTFQYNLLASELKMTIEILQQFDASIGQLQKIQTDYNVQVCALQMALDVSKQTHALLENFTDTKINLALMKKDPEYYRELLRSGLAYLTSSMVSLHSRSQDVLQAIRSAKMIRNEEKRQRAFQELRNLC